MDLYAMELIVIQIELPKISIMLTELNNLIIVAIGLAEHLHSTAVMRRNSTNSSKKVTSRNALELIRSGSISVTMVCSFY